VHGTLKPFRRRMLPEKVFRRELKIVHVFADDGHAVRALEVVTRKGVALHRNLCTARGRQALTVLLSRKCSRAAHATSRRPEGGGAPAAGVAHELGRSFSAHRALAPPGPDRAHSRPLGSGGRSALELDAEQASSFEAQPGQGQAWCPAVGPFVVRPTPAAYLGVQGCNPLRLQPLGLVAPFALCNRRARASWCAVPTSPKPAAREKAPYQLRPDILPAVSQVCRH